MATATPLGVVIACVDGSDHSTESVREGLALLQPAERLVIATVVEPTDPTLVTGSGMAGGVVSGEEYDELDRASLDHGHTVAEEARAALGLERAEIMIVRGDPGLALCDLAAAEQARALVMGSRGRGGIKRALLGSVSDYVVRNAPCPVVITGPKS
jgi:nucleotide-binding universal stress UspA family protein